MRGRAMVGFLVCVLAAGGLTACGDDDDTADPGGGEASAPNELRIVESDYAFAVEGEPTAGTLSITVANQGAEFHELGMSKLQDGKTVDDVRAALESASEDEDEDPLAAVFEGDAIDEIGGLQQPGTGYTITGSGIEAGEYVVLCFLPSPQGEPHFSLGMIEQFTIAEGEGGEAPDADATFTATDDGLDGPETLPAGVTALEVVNDSSISREAILVKLKDGKTLEDGDAWFEAAGDDLPDVATTPLDFFAFVFDAEQDRTLSVDLTPGTWVLVTPDPENPFEGPVGDDPHAAVITVT